VICSRRCRLPAGFRRPVGWLRRLRATAFAAAGLGRCAVAAGLWKHTISRRRQRRPSLAPTRLAATLRRLTVWRRRAPAAGERQTAASRRRAHVLRQELNLVSRPAAVYASRGRSPACRMPSVAAAGLTRDPPSRRHPVAARRQRPPSLPAAPMAGNLW